MVPAAKETKTKKDGKRKITETPEVVPTAGPSQSKSKPMKRHKPNETTKPVVPAPPPTDHGPVIVYRPRNKLPRPTPVITSMPASPTHSFDIVESSYGSSFPSSTLGPPPSVIGTASSSSSVGSQSLTLEVAILRSQLEAANDSLRSEREQARVDRDRHQEEVRRMAEQFDRERKAYQEYIKSAESGGRS